MDKYILVHHLNSINSVISETFKSTQRIKLTCFDVCEECIVFGASSGGIYIFKREPCEFLKLIPSKEGSAIQIAITSNGKNLAVATSKGLVLILEDFLDINVTPLVHSEHEGSTITTIKWHGYTLYSGDEIASAVLMHLDSGIVQIDTYLNYLLLSTKTRTYLCDTGKECYKQIGKKLRDGNYGACFFNVPNNDIQDVDQSFKGIFKTIKADEVFTTTLQHSEAKIYCARPGARIWEANFEATVLVTHQFRDSLDQSPSDLLHLKNDPDARLDISTFKDVGGPAKFSFGKIYPARKFILTYSHDGIYFFDPSMSRLVFWCNFFNNIRQVAVMGSLIFVWQDDLQVIALESLEELIVETLLTKQYYLCAELCTTYRDDVISLIERSNKIHLISILKSKLTEIDASGLLEKLSPVLAELDKFNKKRIAGKKLKNGIVVIENPHKDSLGFDYENLYIPESVRNLNNSLDTLENGSSNEDYCDVAKDGCVKETARLQAQKKQPEENGSLLALYRLYQLNKTHKNVELTKSNELMNSLSVDELLDLLRDFVRYVQNLEHSDATHWCKEQLLKQAAKREVDVKATHPETLSFLKDAFLELCASKDLACKCTFPLPKAREHHLPYYNLGCSLIEQETESVDIYLTNVPYMRKYILSKMETLNDIVSNLPLLVQFGDEELFKQFVMLFTYDTWDEVVKLRIKLQRGKCLNCESCIEVDGLCSWSNLGMLMIRSIGPQNATRLLKRYAQYIPSDGLNMKFYQCCILASTFKETSQAVNFVENVVDENILPKFEEQMAKFLQRKYLGICNQSIKSNSEKNTLKCSYCDMPLNGSIFTDNRICNFSHNFHNLCLLRNNGICNICCPKT